MLYVTTRNSGDTYTARKALTNERCPDGGCFVPYRLPHFDSGMIAQLKSKSYNQTIAEIVNAFFSLNVEKAELPFDSERNFIRMNPMSHRIVIAELWHNLGNSIAYIEDTICRNLSKKICAEISADWPKFVARIAAVFCVYGQMLKEGFITAGDVVDFSVGNDSLFSLMALHYCRNMGLPINTIICTCNESSNFWDLINRGEFSTIGVDKSLCCGVERLLQATLGCDAVSDFCNYYDKNAAYFVSEENLSVLNQGIFCAVAGKERAQTVINSLYRTNGYIADSTTALCYGGLQDYRAKTGESLLTVILAEHTPLNCVDDVSAATGLDTETIKAQLKSEV